MTTEGKYTSVIARAIFGALIRSLCDEISQCLHLRLLLSFFMKAGSLAEIGTPLKSVLDVVPLTLENEKLVEVIRNSMV